MNPNNLENSQNPNTAGTPLTSNPNLQPVPEALEQVPLANPIIPPVPPVEPQPVPVPNPGVPPVSPIVTPNIQAANPVPPNPITQIPPVVAGQIANPMVPNGQLPIQNKKSNKLIIIIIVALVLVVIGAIIYFVLSKPSNNKSSNNNSSNDSGVNMKNKDNCIENFEADASTRSNDDFIISKGDTQYIFATSPNNKFINVALKFEEVSLNICFSNTNESKDFTVGSATKSKKIDVYELRNKTTGNKIKAKNLDDLIKELGYHPYGKHTEEVEILDINTYPTYGSEGNQTYSGYPIKIKLASGKEIEAKYIVYKNQENKIETLEKNKKYTIDFETKEGFMEPIDYLISDFK